MKKKMTDSEMERVVSAELTRALGGLDLRNLTAPQNKTAVKKKTARLFGIHYGALSSQLPAIRNAKTDEEVARIVNTPQNKAPMKKPQRTKASVSSSIPRSTRSRKLSKPAFETQMEQTLLAAVVKYGNNYQLAKLAGTSADIVSRFARKERTLRFDTAAQIADALGLRFQ